MNYKWVWRIFFSLFMVTVSFGQEESEEITDWPTIYKCCQDNEYFDMLTLSCSSADGIHLDDYKIDPGSSDDENDYLEKEGNFEKSNSDESNGNFPILSSQLPNCPSSTHELKCVLREVGKLDDSALVYAFNSTSAVFAIDEGSLRYNQNTPDRKVFFRKANLSDSDQFCVDRAFRDNDLSQSDQQENDYETIGKRQATFEGTVICYCRPNEEVDCKSRLCVNFCCPYGGVTDPNQTICRDSLTNLTADAWKQELYHPKTLKRATKQELSRHPWRIFYNRQESLNCSDLLYTIGVDAWIYLDGTVQAGDNYYSYHEICTQSEESYDERDNFTYTNKLRVCIPDDSDLGQYNKVVNFLVIPILCVISAVCLCFLFVFLWIKDRSKLFASMVLCTIATLAAFYIFLSIIKLGGQELVQNYKISCVVLGFLTQFTNLSAFFWLNTLSFDIWLKFRKLQAPRMNVATLNNRRKYGCAASKFKFYALYSWGIPILIMSCTVVVQYLPKHLQTNLILPGVGAEKCFLEAPKAILWYLFIISAPVLMTNVLFFLLFAYNFVFGFWSESSNMVRRQNYQTSLTTVAKIFVVMGLTWLADIISFFVAWRFNIVNTYKYIAFFDFINALQGVAIMVVMVFDSETVKKIKTKFGAKKGTLSSSGLSMTVFDAKPTTNIVGCE